MIEKKAAPAIVSDTRDVLSATGVSEELGGGHAPRPLSSPLFVTPENSRCRWKTRSVGTAGTVSSSRPGSSLPPLSAHRHPARGCGHSRVPRVRPRFLSSAFPQSRPG